MPTVAASTKRSGSATESSTVRIDPMKHQRTLAAQTLVRMGSCLILFPLIGLKIHLPLLENL